MLHFCTQELHCPSVSFVLISISISNRFINNQWSTSNNQQLATMIRQATMAWASAPTAWSWGATASAPSTTLTACCPMRKVRPCTSQLRCLCRWGHWLSLALSECYIQICSQNMSRCAAGEPYVLKKAVCMHETDAGTLWKHTEYRTGHAEVLLMIRTTNSTLAASESHAGPQHCRFGSNATPSCLYCLHGSKVLDELLMK